MSNKIQKVTSFLTSILTSFLLFLIPFIPAYSIFLNSAEISSAVLEKSTDSVLDCSILLGIETSEALKLFAVEFFFEQNDFSVTEIQQNSEKKTFLELYNYSGASGILSEIGSFYPKTAEKYVILDKNWSKNFLNFFGSPIVTVETSYYNDNNETQNLIFGSDLEESFSLFGGEAVVESIVRFIIGKNRNEFCKNMDVLFENSDTNISYPDFVRNKEKFELLRR